MYFKVIKAVLDSTLAKICAAQGVPIEEGHARLKAHLLAMNAEWFSGENPQINYGDPFCRLAYLYCHTPANANICELAIRQEPAITELVKARAVASAEIRVCAFGGGPGTELLGVSKHLLKIRTSAALPIVEITFSVLDRVVEWGESWESISTIIRNAIKEKWPRIQDRPLHINKSFAPFDMTKLDAYVNLTSYLAHDLYIMNYVVSEVIDDVEDLAAVLARMREAAPADALFLIIDRDQDAVCQRASALVATAGLDIVHSGKSATSMDGDEQSSELDPYITEIGRRPRTQWRNERSGRGIFWVLCRKR